MELKMGDYNHLTVLRETPFAYIVTNGHEEVFLHKRQVVGDIKPKDEVTVFLYYDNQKRITATMNKPILDQTTPNFAKVVSVNFNLGAFLDIGLKKDLLLSKDDLPFLKKEWPEEGDEIFALVKASQNQLTAKLVSRYDVKDYLKPEKELEVGSKVSAIKIYSAEEGSVFITKEGHYIFVYIKHMRKTYRIGEQADITITIVKPGYDYNGTLIEQKEIMLDYDAKFIHEYLEKNDGFMPYTDKTNPKVIRDIFHMSKSAFKRALGTLYKRQLVTLESDGTRLVKDVE
jgi:predicted RNA-binding protein (virulence factor B family)